MSTFHGNAGHESPRLRLLGNAAPSPVAEAPPPVPALAPVPDPKASTLGGPPPSEAEPVREHWERIRAAAPWLGQSDRPLVLELARVLADLDEARQHVRDEGAMLAKQGGMVENPWALREHRCRGMVYRLAREFGLTPAARSRGAG